MSFCSFKLHDLFLPDALSVDVGVISNAGQGTCQGNVKSQNVCKEHSRVRRVGVDKDNDG